MAERKSNLAFWQRMKLAHSKKIWDYAKKHDISNAKAAMELELFRDMENAVIAELRIESEFYYEPSEEE